MHSSFVWMLGITERIVIHFYITIKQLKAVKIIGKIDKQQLLPKTSVGALSPDRLGAVHQEIPGKVN